MLVKHDQLPIPADVRVFDLEQPRTQDIPIHPTHQPGYFYALHRRHEDTYRPENGPRSGAAGVIVCKEHTGTHIDALNHFGIRGKIWNGFKADEHLGDRGWKRTGIASSGVETSSSSKSRMMTSSAD